jgi:hypothetical protein
MLTPNSKREGPNIARAWPGCTASGAAGGSIVSEADNCPSFNHEFDAKAALGPWESSSLGLAGEAATNLSFSICNNAEACPLLGEFSDEQLLGGAVLKTLNAAENNRRRVSLTLRISTMKKCRYQKPAC